jgi:predicted DNA-binding WGR domain protein
MIKHDWRTFKCVNASRNAFWKISEPYRDWDTPKGQWAIMVHYGKNGTKGAYKPKYFESKLLAKQHYIKIISQKYVKGYVEQGEVVKHLTKKKAAAAKLFAKAVKKSKPTFAMPTIDDGMDYVEEGAWNPKKKSWGEKHKSCCVEKSALPPIEKKKKRRMKLGGIKGAAARA